ncbi:MAG: hypothetical protein M3328_15520 [Chloroflexota bacterium]|nr:hypothetical protein [Chloroflexota bacterium]
MVSNAPAKSRMDAMSGEATVVEGSLLPFTKLVLAVSAVVQLVFGVVGLLFTDLWNSFFWTAPLPAWPKEVANFAFLNYLATAVAAGYALYQDKWSGAKVYFAFSFPYIVMSVIAVLVTAANPGVPLIMWLYVLLSVLYLPAVAYAWYSQSRKG